MSDALEKHDRKASIGGRNITNLRFADDIDDLAEEELDFNELKEKFKSKQFNYFFDINNIQCFFRIQRFLAKSAEKMKTILTEGYL